MEYWIQRFEYREVHDLIRSDVSPNSGSSFAGQVARFCRTSKKVSIGEYPLLMYFYLILY
jgi:hypothetical protein